jgi:hypothetical protein
VTNDPLALTLGFGTLFSTVPVIAQDSTLERVRPRILVLYSLSVKTDHALFALDALKFFAPLAEKDNFTLDSTSNREDLNDTY